MHPAPNAPRPNAPRPAIPAVLHAAKWPPDDADLPGGPVGGGPIGAGGPGAPGAPGGPAGGPYDFGDGDFKKGKVRPVTVLVGVALLVGAGVIGAVAVKGAAQKLDTKEILGTKKALAFEPRTTALPKWREWAKRDDVPELQQAAFAQLAWAKDKEAIPLLTKALASSDPRVVGRAAQAIYEYGPEAAETKPALLAALKKKDPASTPQVSWALALQKEEAAFDDVFASYRAGDFRKLERLDGSPAFDPEVLVRLASLDKLATLKGDPSPSVRQLVATALSGTADSKWTSALVDLVQDKDIDVAREAAVGLGRIGNDNAMNPLLSALKKANKDSRGRFLEALRDGIGAKGLVLALQSVDKSDPETEKFQSKVIFDMLKDIADPRVGDALDPWLKTSDPKPHWRTEAGLRMAEVGDVRAASHLGWRLEQDPEKLYTQIENSELRRNDEERIISARMLADLAFLNADKRQELLIHAEKPTYKWITEKPLPYANGMRFLVAAGSKMIVPDLKAWADPPDAFPEPGATGDLPKAWAKATSALRYYGASKDAGAFGVLEKQLNRQGKKKVDVTQEALLQGGMAQYGMTARSLGAGASDGFAELGDNKAYPLLLKYIEDKENHEEARREACFALPFVATDVQMEEVAAKVKQYNKPDPKDAVIRSCFLESLIRRPVPKATAALVDLIKPDTDLGVRHQAARAIGFGGVSLELASQLQAKLKDPGTRTDAALALILGADADVARQALASYDDSEIGNLDELKDTYAASFLYFNQKNLESGDIARVVRNADALRYVSVHEALQDWPKQILSKALQSEIDSGPFSLTRVQLRVRLFRDAKGGDEKRRAEALQILEFLGEKGSLMALKSEPGPLQEQARLAIFRLMNPKMVAAIAEPAKPKK